MQDFRQGRWRTFRRKALPRRRPTTTSKARKPPPATESPTLVGTKPKHEVGTVRRKGPDGNEKPEAIGTYSRSAKVLQHLDPRRHTHTSTHTYSMGNGSATGQAKALL